MRWQRLTYAGQESGEADRLAGQLALHLEG